MSLALFYDTETNGLPLWNEPSNHPEQPHIVQLAAHLVDTDTRNILQSINLISRPFRWTIPDKVAEIHGITTHIATSIGVNESVIVSAFLDLWIASDIHVAHNASFDARIMRIGIMRHNTEEMAERWKDDGEGTVCTMNMAKPIVKMPPTDKMKAKNMTGFKAPTLSEAYEFFFNKKLENAHSALADVDACMAIYFKMVDDA